MEISEEIMDRHFFTPDNLSLQGSPRSSSTSENEADPVIQSIPQDVGVAVPARDEHHIENDAVAVQEADGSSSLKNLAILNTFCDTMGQLINPALKRTQEHEDHWIDRHYKLCPFIARLFRIRDDETITW